MTDPRMIATFIDSYDDDMEVELIRGQVYIQFETGGSGVAERLFDIDETKRLRDWLSAAIEREAKEHNDE